MDLENFRVASALLCIDFLKLRGGAVAPAPAPAPVPAALFIEKALKSIYRDLLDNE